MTSLEELKLRKRKLLAKESLRKHSLERAKEKTKLKSEIRNLKYAKLNETLTNVKVNVKNVAHHVKGRIGMARGRVQQLQGKIDERKKSKKFQGFDIRKITGY